MNKYMTGQDVIPGSGEGAICGFNFRISGYSYRDTFPHPHQYKDADKHVGWDIADRMIEAGKLFFVHNFHSLSCEKGHAFPYRETWACNTCNLDQLDEPWWKIKVFKDGNKWCCIGIDFEDLRSSDNFAFGETREAAIEKYGRMMLQKPKAPNA
jgi:hypothetical protein